MELSKNNIEQVFEFEGLWGVKSKCGLKIIKKEDSHIVIVSELYGENPGNAITSVSAGLAMQIAKQFEIPTDKMVYIESSPEMNSKLSFYDEEYFRVFFENNNGKFSNPSWEKLTKEEFIKLTK